MTQVFTTSVVRQLGTLFECGSAAGLSDRQLIEREHAEALHTEIDRLPASSRLPIILCYFEGLSLAEAARRLRCPTGTVHSRLVRARDRLRRGLARHGMVLSTTALAATLAPRSVSASVSSLLCDSTTRVAIRFAASHAARGALAIPAAAMAEEVLRIMSFHKLKASALAVILLVAVGVGYLSLDAFARSRGEKPSSGPAPSPVRREVRPRATPPNPGRMTVTGRVLGPDGKPAADAPVDIIGTSRMSVPTTEVRPMPYVILGQGTTDGDGRFRIEASRTSSTRFFHIFAIAGSTGPGTAFGCVKLPTDAEQPVAEVHLQPEQVVRGKLFDVNGGPAAGVQLELGSVYAESDRPAGTRFDSPQPILVYHGSATSVGMRAWPKAVATDARGRFTFTGVGRGLWVSLVVHDPRFASQEFRFNPGERDAAKEVSLAVRPATILEGRVLAADTGQPIPDVAISVMSTTRRNIEGTAMARADGRGRFHINPYSGDEFMIQILALDGQPYLSRDIELPWPKGAVRKEIDFTLQRGVPIRGTVTEQGTGRPVAGASIRRFPMKPPKDLVDGLASSLASGEDGSFRLTVPPGKGYLTVVGPTLDYIPREVGGGILFGGGNPGGHRIHTHNFVAYDVQAGETPHVIDVTLKPGKTLRGRIVGPAGEAVQDAVILSRQQIDPNQLTWQENHFIHARDGRFELAGFDPDRAKPVYWLDADHSWGATVELAGKHAGEELTVRLLPCGQAKARFVGPDGKPAAIKQIYLYFQFLMTPGGRRIGPINRGESIAADGAFLPNIDPGHHPNSMAPDTAGRVTFAALIPGALYRISDWSTVNVAGKGYQIRRDFTVKPGETLDLGDILVEGLER
jgi:hypothetical protein